VQKKLADMKGAVMSFANATLKYAAIISAMGVGIAAPLNKAIDSLAARSAELYEANPRTGTSIADLQTIAHATGSSIGSVADGIQGITHVMEDMMSGSTDTMIMMQRLGITLGELQGMTDSERIRRFADGLQLIGNRAQRAAIQARLGLGGQNLEGGSAGVAQREQRARELGTVISPEDVALGRQFNVVMTELKAVVASVWNSIGSAVMPAAIKLFSTITNGLVRVRQFIDDNHRLFQIIDLVAGVLIVGGAALTGLAGAAYAASAAIGVLAFVVSPAGLAIIASLAAIGGAAYLLYQNWDQVSAAVMSTAWGSIFTELASTATQAFGAIGDAMSAGEWIMAAEVAWVSIQLIWAKGINWIRDGWFSFEYLFMTTWDQITAKVMHAMIDIASAALGAFMEIGFAIKSVFISIVGAIAGEINRLIGLIPQSVRTRLGIEAVSFDADAAQQSLDREREGGRNFRDAATTAAHRATDTVAFQRERARAGTHNEERERARNEEGGLQGQLDSLSNDAFIASEMRRQGFGSNPVLRGQPNNVEQMKAQTASMGTFSAEAVRGMDSGPMDRIENNTRATRDAVMAVADLLRAAPPLTMG
jgi:hypothetical protein